MSAASIRLAERKTKAELHAKQHLANITAKKESPPPVVQNHIYEYEQHAALVEKARERERVRQANFLAFEAEEEMAALVKAQNLQDPPPQGGETPGSTPGSTLGSTHGSTQGPIPKPRQTVRTAAPSFKINTNRVILEAFNPSFKRIDPSVSVDIILLNIKSLSLSVVVDSVKKNKNALILVYSESINTHKSNFDSIKEGMFRGYQTMVKDLLAKPNGPKAAELKANIESITRDRENLFSRMFLISVFKNAGFDFPLINPLLLFFSSIIHGHTKLSDMECCLYDPALKEGEPLKRVIISHNGDEGEEVARFLHQNFFVKKKKIFFISNEFYRPTQGEKPTKKKKELLRILTRLPYEDLETAIDQKAEVVSSGDAHRVAYLESIATVYKGKTKILIDAFDDHIKTKTFECTLVKPLGYKICHNIINYVDYLSEGFGLYSEHSSLPSGPSSGPSPPPQSQSLFRFFEIVPPAYLFTSPAPHDYNNHVIYDYLEKHPNDIDQEWFDTDLTYAQTNRILNQMASKKIELEKVFDEIYDAFPNVCESVRVGGDPKEGEDVLDVNIYIFLGDKFSGKTFMAKRFTEYLDSKVPDGESTNVTILGEFKKKLNSSIKEYYTEIVLDAKTLNHEYERRMLKSFLGKSITVASNVSYCFVNIGILKSFKTMLIKYTKAAYPSNFAANTSPKGYYQRNIKGANVIDVTNCFWIDASKDHPDFVFEISRQIH